MGVKLKSKYITFIVYFIFGTTTANIPDSTFIPYIDSIFNQYDSEQVTHVRKIKQDYTYYLSFTCRTLPGSIKNIEEILTDVESFKDIFHYVRQTEVVYDTLSDSCGPLGFCSVGVPFAVSLFLGRLTTEYRNDSLDFIFSMASHEHDRIDKTWKKKAKGWIKVEYYDLLMVWKVRDLGNGKCRVALYTILAPTVWIPQWLFKVAVKKVFPGMLTELEEVVKKK